MNFLKGVNEMIRIVLLVLFSGILSVFAEEGGGSVTATVSLESYFSTYFQDTHTLSIKNVPDGDEICSVVSPPDIQTQTCEFEKGKAYKLTLTREVTNCGGIDPGYELSISPEELYAVSIDSLLGTYDENDESFWNGGDKKITTLYVPIIEYDHYESSGSSPDHMKVFLKCEPVEGAFWVGYEVEWNAWVSKNGRLVSGHYTEDGLQCWVVVSKGQSVFLEARFKGRKVFCAFITAGQAPLIQNPLLPQGELEEKFNAFRDTNEPIDTWTGCNHFSEKRLFAPAPGVPLSLDLSYKSVTVLPAESLGLGWRHSYEWSIVTETNLPAFLHTGSGELYTFLRTTNGTYRSPSSNNWTLEEDAAGYDLDLPGGTTYRFNTNGALFSISDAWGNGVVCAYGTNDCLESVSHSNGRQLVFSNHWDFVLDDWRVDSIQMLDGASLEFDYNADGQFTQVVEQVGTISYTSSYQYDDGFLTNKINGAGFGYAFEYEMGANGLLNGKGIHLAVDGYYDHDVDYVSDDVTDVTYHARGLDQTHRYAYDSTGLLDTHYGPAESIQTVERRGTAYRYDPTGTDILETTLFDLDANASWSEWMDYDAAHNVTNYAVAYNSTNPVHQLSMEYDPAWNLPTAIIDAEGHRTETTYTNSQPLVAKAFHSDTQSYDTHFGYTTNGWLRAITNANDHVVNFGYDSAGNLTKTFAQLGSISTNTFDALGFVQTTETLSESGASTGRITQFDRDAKGRILQTTFADGLTSSASYNALGYLTNSVDRAGRTTDYTYAPTRQLTSITRYLHEGGSNVPVRISYDLDEQMNQLKIIEPRGRYVESYQFDIQDRVTSVTNIEGQVMIIDYGLGDFVNQTTRFDGTTVSNEYDQAGRLAIARISNNEQGMPNVEVNYDYYPDGQQKFISDSASTNTYAYDALNRLTNTTSSVGNSMFDIQYSHDPIGNLTNSVVSIGGAQASATAYEYDAAERLAGILHHRGTEAQSFVYSYSPENGMISSVSNTTSGITCTYQYDLMDRATNIVYKTGSGSLIRGLEYEYDAASMIDKKRILNSEQGTPNSEVNYTYDSIDRLVHESKTSSAGSSVFDIQYSYDLAGNRLSKTENGFATAYTLGTGNRLSSNTSFATNTLFVSGTADEPIGTDNRWGELWVSNLTFTASVVPSINGSSFFALLPAMASQTNTIQAVIRDRAGNTTYVTKEYWVGSSGGAQASPVIYSYNTAGCITNLNGVALGWDERYRLTSVDDASCLVEYTYDVLGRKTTRTEGTNVEHYIHDGNQIIADLDASGNLLRTYVWGQGIDNLLSMTTYTNGGSQASATYYAIKDHQNTIIALTDSTGTIVESYEYDAYGRILDVKDGTGNSIANQKSAIGNRYTFQGREIDWTTGLYYFRARWYDPVAGRFISKDPIRISGGLNLYAFCGNNPVNFTDPDGLRAYSGQETSEIMNGVGDQNIIQAAWNHSGGRKYDFKAQDKLDDGVRNDTYTFNGKTMDSDQFGNFAAGYAGYKTGSFVGLEGVLMGGIMYDFLDAKAKNFKDAKFDWDKDSWLDIMTGAYYARYGKMPPKPE